MKTSVALVVLNNFTNDSRVLKEAMSLQQAGYAVQVLALHEGDLPVCETVSGISVRRIKLWTRGWSKRRAVQLVKYAEFFVRAVVASRKFSILHCNDLDALPVGVMSKWLSFGRRKVIYDAHEFEINCDGGDTRRAIRLRACLESCLLRHVDGMMTVSPSIAKAYRRLYGVTPTLVLNCPAYRPTERVRGRLRETLGIPSSRTVFLYQGGLSYGRGIEMLLEVFSRIERDDVAMVFMGYGPLAETIKQVARTHSSIHFHEAVSPGVLMEYTASADFGVVPMKKNCCNNCWCLPNKFFEYIMAGIPVLTSNLLEPKRIMREFAVGKVANSDSAEQMRDTVNDIMQCGISSFNSCIESAKRKYCWEVQEKFLLGVYEILVNTEKCV